jgi:3-isopropylmalate/(R)-2-methylmalate dehydratase small subunit
VPVRIDATTHAWLLANPGAAVEIDVGQGQVILPDGRRVNFGMDPFARHCLVHGVDELGYLLSRLPEIESWERIHGH